MKITLKNLECGTRFLYNFEYWEVRSKTFKSQGIIECKNLQNKQIRKFDANTLVGVDEWDLKQTEVERR